MKNVLYSAAFGGDCYPFHNLARKVEVVKEAEQMKEKNAVLVVWGGADISPTLYGHAKSRLTWPSDYRDKIEWAAMKRAVALGIPIIGICRGAQMLCALAGGFLIQDVSNHQGGHGIRTYDGSVMAVNSIHHQMMAGLENVEHELLAWVAPKNRSNAYLWKDDQEYVVPEGFKEPEMVYFPKIKGYAIQWHPEAMPEECQATEFILKEYYERENTKATV